MPSQKRKDSARANGAKSRGPVTPEGRVQSSRNSVRHGLRAKSIVLPTESRRDFQSLLDSYIDHFHPETGVERDLVETMAASRWRLLRICTIETTLLANEISRHREAIEQEFATTYKEDRVTFVFQRLADQSQSLALIVRYEGALNRSFDRALKHLLLLQSVRQSARSRPRPNEPKPRSGPGAKHRSGHAIATPFVLSSAPPSSTSLPQPVACDTSQSAQGSEGVYPQRVVRGTNLTDLPAACENPTAC